MSRKCMFLAVVLCLGVMMSTSAWAVPVTGAIFTTNAGGTTVNQNIYNLATDVYLNGGPSGGHNLRPGTYCYQVTDPNGLVLLSTDKAICRQLNIDANGLVSGIVAVGGCTAHLTSTNMVAGGT